MKKNSLPDRKTGRLFIKMIDYGAFAIESKM